MGSRHSAVLVHLQSKHVLQLFLCAPEQDVKAVAWHPSGRLLASCSYDDSIKLWREADGEWACEQTLSGARRS